MKRIIFSMLMLVIASFTFAQFDLGVKAGYNSSLNITNISTSLQNYGLDDVKSEMWNNFQGGLFARVFINKKLYIQPELMYSIQKKEYDLLEVMIGGTATDVNTYMKVSNVEVPLYIGYKLLDLKVAAVRLFAGPKFIMDAGSSLDYKNITNEQITAAGLINDFKESQIDLEFGAGIDVLMLALDAKVNLMQDVAGKLKSIEDVSKIPVPTSNFVISLAWKLF